MINTFGKIVASTVAILSFIFYAFYTRAQDNQALLVARAVPIATMATTVQLPSSASPTAPASTTNSQAYVDQMNAEAAQSQTAQSQQQAVAKAQAQQQAAQPAAQENATAQAPVVAQSSGRYKNGTYTGSSVNVYYGNVQVQAVIQGGQIVAVNFLQYPSDRSTSRYINSQAMPLLQQEAIQAQSAHINGVSGASATSQGFVQSLSEALSQA
jgi:uncharacterized protein with FMN-binding domain